MKKFSLGLILSLGAVLVAVTPARAEMYQWQSQSSSQNSSFSMNCDGSCSNSSSSFESSSSLEQRQAQGTGNGYYVGGNDSWGYKPARRSNRYNDSYWNSDTSGQVTLNWGYRGGTCYVRYTEAVNRYYNYNTQTGCDDGHIIIGGLQTGVKYRFQVKQDNGYWSSPITATAN